MHLTQDLQAEYHSRMKTTFWKHAGMVMRRAFLGFGWARDMALGACFGVASIFLQVRWELISLQDWSTHKWQWVGSVVIPVLAVLVIHIMWRLVTAPWRVHQDQEEEYHTQIINLEQENSTLKEELSREQTKP